MIRPFLALLILGIATMAGGADRASLPDNPDARRQPADRSADLSGDGPVIATLRAVTVHDDPDDFVAAIDPTYYFDDFEWVDWGDIYEPSWTFGPVHGYSYVASAPGNLFSLPGAFSTAEGRAPITIEFVGANVTAVAGDFYVSNFDGDPRPGTIDVTLDDGTVVSLTYPTAFVGFTSDTPIASLVLAIPAGTNSYATFDNVYVGKVGTVGVDPVSWTRVKSRFD